MKALAEAFGGRKVHPGTQVFVTTSNGVKSAARNLGYLPGDRGRRRDRARRGLLLHPPEPVADARRERLDNMVSNSAKIVNIIGAHKFNTILRRTRDCVEIACCGELSSHRAPRWRRIEVGHARLRTGVEGEAVVFAEGFSPRYDLDRWTRADHQARPQARGHEHPRQDSLLPDREGRHRRGLGVLRHQAQGHRAEGVRLRRDQPGDGAGCGVRRTSRSPRAGSRIPPGSSAPATGCASIRSRG